MIKGIEFYFIVWLLFMGLAIGFREMTGREKWEAAKVVWFGAWTAAIALTIVVVIVVIF